MASRRSTFYRCPKCGSVVVKLSAEGEPPMCCGAAMEVLEPYTEDNPGPAAAEKHLPVITRDKRTITVHVGSQPHPMESDHYIEWVYAVTEMGVQMVKLIPGIAPYAEFYFGNDIPLTFYAYCNKHGLWATKMFDSMQEDDD
jgi:superoxide reductase